MNRSKTLDKAALLDPAKLLVLAGAIARHRLARARRVPAPADCAPTSQALKAAWQAAGGPLLRHPSRLSDNQLARFVMALRRSRGPTITLRDRRTVARARAQVLALAEHVLAEET